MTSEDIVMKTITRITDSYGIEDGKKITGLFLEYGMTENALHISLKYYNKLLVEFDKNGYRTEANIYFGKCQMIHSLLLYIKETQVKMYRDSSRLVSC
jgi:hypothetical protein